MDKRVEKNTLKHSIAQDIDEEVDFFVAEQIYKYNKLHK